MGQQNRNNKNSMSWMGWAIFWTIAFAFGLIFVFGYRSDVMAWREIGVPVDATVTDITSYTEETVGRRNGGRIRRSNQVRYQIWVSYKLPADSETETFHGSLTTSSADDIAPGDVLELLVDPNDPVEKVLKSGIDAWPSGRFLLVMGLIILGLLWTYRQAYKELDESLSPNRRR